MALTKGADAGHAAFVRHAKRWRQSIDVSCVVYGNVTFLVLSENDTDGCLSECTVDFLSLIDHGR